MDYDGQIIAVAIEATDRRAYDLNGLTSYCLDNAPLVLAALDAGEEPEDYFDDLLMLDGRFFIDADQLVVRVDRLLDGVVFTYRLAETDIESGVLRMVPHLVGLMLDNPDLTWADGSPVEIRGGGGFGSAPDDQLLSGPDGWLDPYAAGTVLAFRRERNTLHVDPVEAPERGNEAEALRAEFDAIVFGDLRVTADDLLRETVLMHPDVFRSPVPPVSELLDQAGLEIVDGWIGDVGAAEAALADRLTEARDRVVKEFQLEPCCVAAYDRVRAALGADDYATLNHRALTDDLAHGPTAEALMRWIELSDVPPGRLPIGAFAAVLIDNSRRGAAPARYLLALHHQAEGETLAAEADLEQAIVDDPDYGLALAQLAWYASDRGQAQRAVTLLRRAGVAEDDPMLSFLSSLGGDHARVGSNEPCPCGSGRKYKTCHLNDPDVTPGRRVTWLQSKLGYFVTTPAQRHHIVGMASSAMPPDFEVQDLAAALEDDFIHELAVYEGGVIEEFLDERGMLLPDEEVDILDLWSMARLALWEVADTNGVDTTTLRDTRTGDEVTVTDRATATGFRLGEFILARPLPGWGSTWMSGVALRIDLRHRQSAIDLFDQDPSADEIAMWYGAQSAPPEIQTREGEDIVLCRAELVPAASWDELEEYLDATYERDDDEPAWRETHALENDQRILRATILRKEEVLTVDTHSRERMERVLGVLEAHATLVARADHPINSRADLAAAVEAAGGHPLAPDEEEPFEVSPDDVTEIARQLEDRWVSESVPALGGLTPEQAADDPTRRADLINLLASFETMSPPGFDRSRAITMDVARLRRRLGLDED